MASFYPAMVFGIQVPNRRWKLDHFHRNRLQTLANGIRVTSRYSQQSNFSTGLTLISFSLLRCSCLPWGYGKPGALALTPVESLRRGQGVRGNARFHFSRTTNGEFSYLVPRQPKYVTDHGCCLPLESLHPIRRPRERLWCFTNPSDKSSRYLRRFLHAKTRGTMLEALRERRRLQTGFRYANAHWKSFLPGREWNEESQLFRRPEEPEYFIIEFVPRLDGVISKHIQGKFASRGVCLPEMLAHWGLCYWRTWKGARRILARLLPCCSTLCAECLSWRRKKKENKQKARKPSN